MKMFMPFGPEKDLEGVNSKDTSHQNQGRSSGGHSL